MIFSSQLGSPPNSFAPLVERVDARDDHVLVYLKEVRLCTMDIHKLTSFHVLCIAVHPVLQVSKCNPMSYNLQLKQVLAVNNLKPAVINVYDYYQPSMFSSSWCVFPESNFGRKFCCYQ